jgi:hypothetical protein
VLIYNPSFSELFLIYIATMAEVAVEDVNMGEEAVVVAEGSTTEKAGDTDVNMTDGDDKEKMLKAAKQSASYQTSTLTRLRSSTQLNSILLIPIFHMTSEFNGTV